MKRKQLVLCTIICLTLAILLGCGNDDNDDPNNTDTGECADVTTLDLIDSQNYSFSSTLEIESTVVKSESDILFDWSGLTQDMLGNTIDPISDIGMIQIVLWELTEQELMNVINNDAWTMAMIEAPGMIYTYYSTTTANYLDLLSAGGQPIAEDQLLDYVNPTTFLPETHTYCVMMSTGETLGQDAAMLALFSVDPDETNTDVIITSDSTDLAYEVDLNSLTKPTIPAGTSSITMDWTSSLETNGLGQEFVPTSITEAMLAHYPNMTADDVEADFLHLEELAETLYKMDIPAGTSVELGQMTTDDGEAFTGIDDTGIWVFGLMCGACSNPAPWYLTILESC